MVEQRERGSESKRRLPVATAYSQALEHFNAGRFSQADQLCTAIIKAAPDHIDAMNLLGLVAQQVDRHDLAHELFQRAIGIDGSIANLYVNLAVSFEQLGRIEEAVAASEAALAREPGNVRAAQLLQHLKSQDVHDEVGMDSQARATEVLRRAVKLHQAGALEQAVACYRQTLALQPDNHVALGNMGFALESQGLFDAAIACYQKAIAANPQHVDAHFNLGNAFNATGKLSAAVESYKNVVTLKPDHAEAYNNLGSALMNQGELSAAVVNLQKAIALKADFAQAHYNLGSVKTGQGEFAEAESCYKQALAIDRNHLEAHYNLGVNCHRRGKLDAAVASYRQAVTIKPDYYEAFANLGAVLLEQGKLDEALECLQKTIAINPDQFTAYGDLGNLFLQQGLVDDAVASFQKAIANNPDNFEAYGYLGNAMRKQGRLDAAVSWYQKALTIQPDAAEVHSQLLFCLQHGDHTAEKIAEAHRIWNDHQAEYLQSFLVSHNPGKKDKRPLKVGFVSGNFHKNSLGSFLQALFSAHDRRKTAFYCYANSSRTSRISDFLQNNSQGWRNITYLDDTAAVAMIRTDAIDILVDLAGHAPGNRLGVFARKAAPVQVSWLGYPHSTGLVTIDYRISDAGSDQTGDIFQYGCEELLRLPEGLFCYTPPEQALDVAFLPMKKNGYVTFAAMGNLAKISRDMVTILVRILKEVPDSRLFVQCKTLASTGVRQRFVSIFADESISPERLILSVGDQQSDAQCSKYADVDVGLDTFPFNAAHGICEALWMGVPVIGLRGSRHASRVGAGILTNIGLEQLVGADVDDYVARAVSLAADSGRLEKLRFTLRKMMATSSLCDAAGFAGRMEEAWQTMWNRWCANGGPKSDAAVDTGSATILPSSPPLKDDSAKKKPVIRLIHHLGRTGGTLFCKCLGAMDDVVLLSEINPRGLHFFNPVSQAVKWHGLGRFEDFAELGFGDDEAFLDTVEHIDKLVQARGKSLVVRDWTHLDFIGYPYRQPLYRLNLEDLLSRRFTIKSVFTVRHPLDQWLSHLSADHVHFSTADTTILPHFLDGCRRFGEICAKRGFFRYEDFTRDADQVLKDICAQLDLDFDAGYKERWQSYPHITGDRVGKRNNARIVSLPRRTVDPELLQTLEANPDFKAALSCLGYD